MAVRVHESLLILSLTPCKGLAPPGYSSPKTRAVRKLKLVAFDRSPRTLTPPWCQGVQPGPLSTWLLCHAAHWPTDFFWATPGDLGLASALLASASSCLSFSAWHRAVMTKMVFLKEIHKEEL